MSRTRVGRVVAYRSGVSVRVLFSLCFVVLAPRESGFLWVGAVSLVPADSTWAGLAVLCFPGVPNHSLYFTLYTSTHVCVDMYMILMIWLNKLN